MHGGLIVYVSLMHTTAPPEITEVPVDMRVPEGVSLTFQCAAVSDPVPSFQWHFNDAVLTNSNKYSISVASDMSNLTLHDVSPSDVGDYICYVTNIHGSVAATAQLHLLRKL